MTQAPYASDPRSSRGRLYLQPASGVRDEFQRDRDRIIHSSAFRRLRYKTQVFVAPDGDHFRVRLTHSLEVAQIGRTIARALGLNEDLTEALCLAHDIGHPPFGHSGEDVLEACMAPYGGFDHNAHTIRMVTKLEQRYPLFDGLNLTWETLEGLAKHNGPVYMPTWALAEYDAIHSLDLSTYASLEAQIAAIADDIAYDNHDLDDGLRAGLFELEEALEVPFVAETWATVTARYPDVASRRRMIPELVREQIGRMVDDLLVETRRRIAEADPKSVEDVRNAGRTLVGFSPTMKAAEDELKQFLRARMYSHEKNRRVREPAAAIVAGLFKTFHADPRAMPDGWGEAAPMDEPARARHVADFIAGMTDRYAIRTYEQHIGPADFPNDALI